MAALANAAINHVVRELIDRQHLTSSADFAIATAANLPLPTPVGVDGLDSITTTSMVSTPTAMAAGGHGGGDDQGECRLLGPFALLVQLALGGLALMSLVYKRWRERPQRPLKIWFFDASKQVFGSVLVHIANVFMSMLTSGRFSIKVEPASVATVRAVSMMVVRSLVPRHGHDGGAPDDEYTPNPCSFYLLNLAIDVSWLQEKHVLVTSQIEKLTNLSTDNTRHPHSYPPFAHIHWPRFLHASRAAARVDPVGQLRKSTKCMVVAQAIGHLLLRSIWHEVLRPYHLPDAAMDLTRWRLGPGLDRGEREGPDRVRDDALPPHYECDAVLHHRLLHQEAGVQGGR